MARTRSLATLLAVVAAGLALCGCSLLAPAPHPTPAPTAKSDAPTVGQCWNGTYANAGDWADWQGDAAVACSASHTLYTFGVAKIAGLLPTDWAKSATDPSLSDTVANAASTACEAPFEKAVPGLAWNQQLVRNFFFVPSEAQWKKGERWVRCDVGVLDYGTSLSAEQFAPLPSFDSVVSAINTDPTRFTMCLNTPKVAITKGPYPDKGDVITDCRANPQWSLVLDGAMSGGDKAPYPSDKSANSQIGVLCARSITGSNQIWRGYYPSKTQWANGNREIDCWVSPKHWTSATGTNA